MPTPISVRTLAIVVVCLIPAWLLPACHTVTTYSKPDMAGSVSADEITEPRAIQIAWGYLPPETAISYKVSDTKFTQSPSGDYWTVVFVKSDSEVNESGPMRQTVDLDAKTGKQIWPHNQAAVH